MFFKLSTEMSVAMCCLHMQDVLLQRENKDVKGSPSKVREEDIRGSFFNYLFLKTKSHSCSCWFVDDPCDVESSDLSCIFGGLSLSYCEIGWNRDHCICDFLPNVILWLTGSRLF